MFTVAIVGRPNVGKSTLFNRLVGRRVALVDDAAGVTRDRREGRVETRGLVFDALDTAGLEDAKPGSLAARMSDATERAVGDADLALLVVDGRAGITPVDAHFARRLRKLATPVILVANKREGRANEAALAECHALGLGAPIAISAEHGLGIPDLLDAIRARMPPAREPAAEPGTPESDAPESDAPDSDTPESDALESEPADELKRPLQLAILGRPNVGKSTLANRLIGAERLLTGPEPGITRDAIGLDWDYRGRAIHLVDTAGLRRRGKVTDRLERLSASATYEAVRYAEVVLLVVEGTDPINKQDLGLARLVLEEGRALAIAVNKWDAVRDRRKALAELDQRLEVSLAQAKGIEAIPVSAKTGLGLEKMMAATFEAHRRWNARISTSRLNRFLAEVVEAHPPPLSSGRRSKIRFIAQPKTRPPTFALFGNKLEDLPESYLRYLTNAMREAFDLPGVPIRLTLRRGENPYHRK